ncbi:hypothetical protein SAMN04487969_12236 [Paenibacillus algorifonticola]|uniref:Uncharacterized protein n=1 Tax=Paenibacillus algorifonticola TaxID=684063 RepID=A0A1I2HDN3_9BACL|nr:hypothetical protein SAMN04487969_12236 [Paenibacillus algorifonticola]
MPVDIKCPPITLRGCDNGESHMPKTSTQVAPNGAIIHTRSDFSVSERIFSGRLSLYPDAGNFYFTAMRLVGSQARMWEYGF